jgi:hypothetical protein
MPVMIRLALVLAAITGRTEILNETMPIPHSQWRAMKVELRDRPATVEVEFRVTQGRSGVRVVFMTADDLKRFEKGERHEVLAQTEYAEKGSFRYLVGNPGDYRILLDNRLEGRDPAEVAVKVSLAYHEYSSFAPRTLPPGKRRAVVGLSLALFALAALWIGRKLAFVFA